MTSEMAAMTLQNGGDNNITRCTGTCRSHWHNKMADVVPAAKWQSSQQQM
jgi:hypothetical protein